MFSDSAPSFTSLDQQIIVGRGDFERDAYGNEVGVSAKRLPVAYLLVDVPCGVAPASQQPTFSPRASFPPANRALPRHVQSLRALHRHIEEAPSFLEAASDFHVLLYMASNEALPLSLEQLQPLLDAVRARDAAAADAWRAAPHAATLLRLARAAAEDAPPDAPGAPGSPGAPAWTCPLCTFHNAAPLDACEMCAMPSASRYGRAAVARRLRDDRAAVARRSRGGRVARYLSSAAGRAAAGGAPARGKAGKSFWSRRSKVPRGGEPAIAAPSCCARSASAHTHASHSGPPHRGRDRSTRPHPPSHTYSISTTDTRAVVPRCWDSNPASLDSGRITTPRRVVEHNPLIN
ncbi:unnamed protein product [Euphydryas editha]|uniref:RanBP2-type domain-containing protein n=1 Tax=Euphydryas editha TaxID=104508 RepID=A0AAU9V2H8_EUPED|nr:unnamed protein product [Euphydryas editha]